ncbi:MAG: hypothetical protein ABSE77_22385 [Acidimicrobiales bacterium]|jgi:hypothetical protein
MREAHIRIFTNGRNEQLPGLVETLNLPRGQSFYIAFRESVEEKLAPWAKSSCRGWQRIDVALGLPAGWVFAYVNEATTDDGPRAVDDRLGFPDRRTLHLAGGIPGGVRGTFFWFAPPRIVLGGPLPGDTVTCNGQTLVEDTDAPGCYHLPRPLLLDTRIGIEAGHDDDLIRRSLYLVSGAGWQLRSALAAVDGYGRRVCGARSGIAGAAIPLAGESALPVDMMRTPGLPPEARRIFFVGRAPGQIVLWPKERLPDWRPVWAVPFSQHGQALFCGSSLADDVPVAKEGVCDERLELWHKLLWHWRKRITPPKDPAMRALWAQYREAARVA